MVVMQHSEPPPGAEIGRWPLDTASELVGLRRIIRAEIAEHSTTDLAERLVLVLTELAGNALVHGSRPVSVRLLGGPQQWIIEVSDSDRAAIPALSDATARTVRGRGLPIVQAVTEAAGWYLKPTAKVVWAVIANPAP